jgi:hypothetical protein
MCIYTSIYIDVSPPSSSFHSDYPGVYLHPRNMNLLTFEQLKKQHQRPGDVDAVQKRDGSEAGVVTVGQLDEPLVRHLAEAQVQLLHVRTVLEYVAQALEKTIPQAYCRWPPSGHKATFQAKPVFFHPVASYLHLFHLSHMLLRM